MFPEYEWLPWKFSHSAKHFWEDVRNQRRFMEWAAKQLNIKGQSDWYNVTYMVTIVIQQILIDLEHCKYWRGEFDVKIQ
jgi:hypothetical protein